MDPKTSVLNVSTEILAELLKTNAIALQELDNLIQTRINEKARINFIPSISFLYLLGCLDYDIDSDAIYYIKERGKYL
jgi:hypothetical protein